MTEKTLGEVAHDSNPDRSIMKAWGDLTPATQTLYEVMASAVRKTALEEAIASIKYEAQFFDANGKTAAKRITTVLERLIGDSNA